MAKINIDEIPEGMSFEDYPDDTLFVHRECFHRYILDPFEIIFHGDPRYETALTREEVDKIIEKEGL